MYSYSLVRGKEYNRENNREQQIAPAVGCDDAIVLLQLSSREGDYDMSNEEEYILRKIVWRLQTKKDLILPDWRLLTSEQWHSDEIQ